MRPGALRTVQPEPVGAEQEQVHQREAAVTAGQDLFRDESEPLGAETSRLGNAVAPAVAAGVGTVAGPVAAVERTVERNTELELITGGLAAREIEVQPLGPQRRVPLIELRLDPDERGRVHRIEWHVRSPRAS